MKLDPEEVDTIVIHITDSPYGDVDTINQWHLDRGWAGIGYHYLITNCFPTKSRWELKRPDLSSDGKVMLGRSTKQRGAHAKGHNWHSLGVAMVGKRGAFTARQLEAAVELCKALKVEFPITEIIGHFEVSDKTCPDLDMDLFRGWC